MDRVRENDKTYLPIYRVFYDSYQATKDKEIRSLFAYTLGRFKELAVWGASKEALKTAAGLNRTLPRLKPYKNPFPKALVCEHDLTKTQVLDMLLDREIMPVWNDKTALDILGKSRCCWITCEEDGRLTARGWKNIHPPCAYKQAGINVEPLP
jgi:hypothetical protein